MKDIDKIIISLAIEQAHSEGITDEEQAATRAMAIIEDTQAKIELELKANAIIEDHKNGIVSPFFPQPEFPMNDFYGKTVNASLKQVFQKITEHCETLGRQMDKPSAESDQEKRRELDNMSLGVFKILNDNKVPLAWYGPMFEDIKQIIIDLDTIMKDQVKGHMKEIMSRTLGAKHPNPKKAKFNDEFATYADLLAARERVKEQTGGKDEDYFQEKGDTLE